MPSPTMTDNYRLMRSLYSKASGWATSESVRAHEDEFRQEYDRTRMERDEHGALIPTGTAWNRAARTLCKKYAEEFSMLRTMRHAQLQVQHDYVPAPRGGFATGRHARVVPDADADAS